MSESRDELGAADIISSGGRDFGAFWARVIRSRWARVAAIPVLAGLVAAAALLVPRPHPATRPAAPGQQAAITNTTAGLGPGTFAAGTAGGRQWQLDVQDIADPGFRCLPGVSIDGNDAYPLLRMFWLNWVDANDRPIAGFTGLPGYGFMQFWPNGLPTMKTEVWSTSWAN